MNTNKRLTSPIMIVTTTMLVIASQNSQAFESKFSGQVSRMVVLPDDAVGSETQHQDIGWSGSRFRFTGSEDMNNGMKVGFHYEIQARNNKPNANGANLSQTGDDQDNRFQDVWFSGDFGKISLGKGDGASNGGTEVDFSGTALASSSNHQDNWGAYEILPGTAWSSVFKMFDGLSRQNRVRYDTPEFSGFSLAVSSNQGNASEFAVRYKTSWSGNKFAAAVFVDQAPDVSATVDGNDISGFSGSLLLNSGFNFTVAYSESEDGNNVSANDREATTFKVGYKAGMHAFSVDIGNAETNNGDIEGDTTGFTYAVFPHPGVELFATARELDSDGIANASSVDLIAFGTRVKF